MIASDFINIGTPSRFRQFFPVAVAPSRRLMRLAALKRPQLTAM
jgi:hypothetical protein